MTLPIGGLLEETESEAHHEPYEDWTGEFADGDLTDDDFRRDLEPAFEALAAVRRSILEKLDGLVRLAFDLGELLDRGTCPPDVYRLLGRPRPPQAQATPPPGAAPKALRLNPGMRINQPGGGEPEGEPRWRSVMPGDLAPDSGWYDEVRQLLIETAIGLGLPPASLLVEQVEGEESTSGLVVRITQGVTDALIAIEERRQDGEENHAVKIHPAPDATIHSQTSVPTTSVTVEVAAESHLASGPEQAVPEGERTIEITHELYDSPRFAFEPENRTVVFDGKRFPNLDPFVFKAFRQIYETTCKGGRITGKGLGRRASRSSLTQQASRRAVCYARLPGRQRWRLRLDVPSKKSAIVHQFVHHGPWVSPWQASTLFVAVQTTS